MRPFSIFILTTLLIGLLSCNNSGDSIFTDKNYQDSIKQDIGGYLIRDIHYSDDFHSWDYNIKYTYKDNLDSIFIIGLANYQGEEIPEDEQLIQIDKWILFKTSKSRDSDNLIVGDKNKNIWIEYEISPESIEKVDLWKEQNIDSRTDNWDSIAKVQEIDSNGDVSVVYTYVKKKWVPFFKTGKKKVIYSLNKKSGKLQMTKVLDI